MAKYYGDIPCVDIGGKVHTTNSDTKWLCGARWKCGYRNEDRSNTQQYIIWREFETVTCENVRNCIW